MLTLRQLGVLQWAGLLAGAVVLAVAHLAEFWIGVAGCDRAGNGGGVDHATIVALTGASALIVLAAAAVSAVVLARTRDADPGDDARRGDPRVPREPRGRLHFFAAAALAANTAFLGVILLDGVGAIFNVACRPS
ncbi:MAG: hypothetical protein R2878_12730 [Thermoleophilia bacterium]